MAFIWRISSTAVTGRICLKHVNYDLDTYRQTFDKFLLAGDFNIEETDPIMSEFLFKNDSKNLVQQKTCFKSTNNPSCIDLFVTNSPRSFQIQ